MGDGPAASPLVQNLLMADSFYVEPTTSKISILGIFNSFSVAAGAPYPVSHLFAVVYLTLTECYGRCQLRLQIVDDSEEQSSIFDAAIEVDVPDPLGVAVVVQPVQMLTFPHPGDYFIQVLCGEDLLKEIRLIVIQL
jgi:hypothetical protein